MPVYSYRRVQELKNSLAQMSSNFFPHTDMRLTPDEFIAAFIKPDHISRLREIEDLTGFIGNERTNAKVPTGDGAIMTVHTTFAHRPPIILPRYVAQEGLQPTCPEDLRKKIVDWAGERLNLARAFSDVEYSIYQLNELCDSAETINMLLPCFSAIMASISEDSDAATSKRARKLESTRRVGRMPRLSRATKERMLEASSIVGAVILAKDAVIQKLPKQHASMSVYELPPVNSALDFSGVGVGEAIWGKQGRQPTQKPAPLGLKR